MGAFIGSATGDGTWATRYIYELFADDRGTLMRTRIELSYDAEADAAYVYLEEQGDQRHVARTRFCNIELKNAAINVDFDDQGHVVGIELLGAAQLLPPPLLE